MVRMENRVYGRALFGVPVLRSCQVDRFIMLYTFRLIYKAVHNQPPFKLFLSAAVRPEAGRHLLGGEWWSETLIVTKQFS